MKELLSRRDFLVFSISSFASFGLAACGGCKKEYIRPADEVNLGKVQELFEPFVDLQSKALMVFLDERGWSVMSTRCTVEGCTVSYNVDKLVCSCCRSVYSIDGKVVNGPAEHSLPWYSVKLANGMLYAEVGKIVGTDYRFTHPDLANVMKHIPELLEAAKHKEPANIPEILQGKGDQEIGRMFIENQPDDYFYAEREKERKLLRQQKK